MVRSETSRPAEAGCLFASERMDIFKPSERMIADSCSDPGGWCRCPAPAGARRGGRRITVMLFCRALPYNGSQEFSCGCPDLFEPCRIHPREVKFTEASRSLRKRLSRPPLRRRDTQSRSTPMVRSRATALPGPRIDISGRVFVLLRARRQAEITRLGCCVRLRRRPVCRRWPRDLGAGMFRSGFAVGQNQRLVDGLAWRAGPSRRRSQSLTSAVPDDEASDVVMLTASPESPLGARSDFTHRAIA